MRRAAVTGGIAEGKSTVLGYLRTLGYSTASMDHIARDVYGEPEVQRNLANLLGYGSPVDRDVLRTRIAEDSEVRRAVNRILHPILLQRMLEANADFIEVPLLIETCIQGLFDEVWVVSCDPDEQLRRLSLRVGMPEALKLIRSQLPTSAKLPFADFIVRTNEPETSVFALVRQLA